ncbi:hypothetical protein EDC01DRAFT_650426 [Geopyxis carbonaria]|nr:hypothetical protein EDC01DRAFT_650426 [Geopyxis carbonaria]
MCFFPCLSKPEDTTTKADADSPTDRQLHRLRPTLFVHSRYEVSRSRECTKKRGKRHVPRHCPSQQRGVSKKKPHVLTPVLCSADINHTWPSRLHFLGTSRPSSTILQHDTSPAMSDDAMIPADATRTSTVITGTKTSYLYGFDFLDPRSTIPSSKITAFHPVETRSATSTKTHDHMVVTPGRIAGAAAVGFAAMLIVAVLVYVVWRRRRARAAGGEGADVEGAKKMDGGGV